MQRNSRPFENIYFQEFSAAACHKKEGIDTFDTFKLKIDQAVQVGSLQVVRCQLRGV